MISQKQKPVDIDSSCESLTKEQRQVAVEFEAAEQCLQDFDLGMAELDAKMNESGFPSLDQLPDYRIRKY